MARPVQKWRGMNTTLSPRYPHPANSLEIPWNDMSTASIDDLQDSLASLDGEEWVEGHPISTFAVALGASITGGAAWVSFFMWFFQQWRDVLIAVPLVLAVISFALFRWLFHRLH
jgi:hypothetical protein